MVWVVREDGTMSMLELVSRNVDDVAYGLGPEDVVDPTRAVAEWNFQIGGIDIISSGQVIARAETFPEAYAIATAIRSQSIVGSAAHDLPWRSKEDWTAADLDDDLTEGEREEEGRAVTVMIHRELDARYAHETWQARQSAMAIKQRRGTLLGSGVSAW